MKVQEVKLRIETFADNFIDTYFDASQIQYKFANATCKYMLHLNIYRLDPIIEMFKDQNGEIDIDELVRIYKASLFKDGKLEVDVKKLIPLEYQWVSAMLPLKLIIFNEADIDRIFFK